MKFKYNHIIFGYHRERETTKQTRQGEIHLENVGISKCRNLTKIMKKNSTLYNPRLCFVKLYILIYRHL